MSLPPAEIASQMAHVDDNRQAAVIAAIVVTTTLATASVVLRFVARYIARIPLEGDDWLVLVSLILAIGYTACDGLSIRFGLGRHAILLTVPQAFLANSLAAEILWAAALLVVKISILLLYLRIFPSRGFRISAYYMLAFVTAYSVASILTFLLQCTPIQKSWDPSVPGTCIQNNIAFPVTGALNVLTDLGILSLPLPHVWRLKLDTTRKLQVVGMFLLGGLVCIISITRIVYVQRVSNLDPTWTFTDASIWTQSEVCAAIVSACLPTYRPLLRGKAGATTGNTYGEAGTSSGYIKNSHRYNKMSNSRRDTHSEVNDPIPLTGIQRTIEINVESSPSKAPIGTETHSRAPGMGKVGTVSG